ncbi:hypothetical protein JOB18_006148 [Solea senegalensis]|uniref:DUF4614 domain-containing protein n=1 Tax=Solea senegalensis TaxID=28829 RepID=A0AAV6RCV2_SOLSE|nr:uncharacterized protein C19orf44 homolog isoform X2 [Solea senegalensis]KAG7501767.1 hypothetical protein JOB18_006148 [Solea senegalensis]
MWKRGGRSSALVRAEALLSAKRSSTGASESSPRSIDTTREHAGAVDKFMKTRYAPPNPHTLLSDLSVSSSSAENGADTLVPEKIQVHDGVPTKALRPQSSLEVGVEAGQGGGSRFLKKVPPPSTNNSQSPVRTSQTQPMSEPRYVSSSQHSSQTAVISRLAQIESRFRKFKQNQEPVTQGIPSPSPEPERRPVSSQSSSEQSLKGKRFLKTKAAVAADNTNAAASGTPTGSGPGVGFRSRAAGAALSSVGLEKKSLRVVSGVSLESDEEDMKKLLGDSVDSTDRSLFGPQRTLSVRTANKENRSPPASVCPSPPSDRAPPRSPASPSSHSSPFRFTGHVRAQFSPSALSLSPSPPHVSPSPKRRQKSPPSFQRSFSSMSGHKDVLSLEELFPAGRRSEDPDSDMSSVAFENFKMNVMTVDDLVPAAFEITDETPRKEIIRDDQRDHQLPRLRVEEEEVLDYQSDFESEIRTEMDDSAKDVAEDLQGEETDVVSEVRKEAWSSDASSERMKNDYSSRFSDTDSQTSGCSRTSESYGSSSRSSRSVSHSRRTPHHQRRRSASSERKNVKDVAVQTQPDTVAYSWSTGTATFNPPSAPTFMTYTPPTAYTLSAERVEALSTFSPAVFALNEMLKQQLAMTRRFIESSQRIHFSLVQSLEPPNYRYTTLEDTKERVRKHRSPKLTMEEALEKVQQEMSRNCT